MGVIAREFFEYVDAFMDYRKTVYEVSDQTLKSNGTDLSAYSTPFRPPILLHSGH